MKLLKILLTIITLLALSATTSVEPVIIVKPSHTILSSDTIYRDNKSEIIQQIIVSRNERKEL